MAFFDPFLPDPDDLEDEEWDDDDDGNLASAFVGGGLDVDVILARSATAAVALRKLVVFPGHFEFEIEMWVRNTQRRRYPFTHVPFGMTSSADVRAGKTLRLGLLFPDGAAVTNLESWPLSPDATEPAHGLQSHSGSGNDNHYTQEYEAWPVPETGLLTFVVAWPVHGIDETRYELATEPLQQALGRVEAVWPDIEAATPGRGRWRPHSSRLFLDDLSDGEPA